MTPDEIKAIRERCEKATGGPWGYERTQQPDGFIYEIAPLLWQGRIINWNLEVAATVGDKKADADFIAHARSDVPALLAEVDRLRGVLRRCRAFIAAIRDSNTEDGRSGVGNDILTAIDRALSGDDAQGGR